MDAVLKHFSVRAEDAELQDNFFRGYPAVMGNLDQGGDVIFPGAFKDAIDGFLRSGFVPKGHEWYDLPIATPKAAEERGNKLWAEAEYHSTPAAQDARTVVKERLERGLDVGLSIGFEIADDGAQMFDNGEKLLEFAGEQKSDTSLFDASLKAHKGKIRGITKIGKLFEFSIVSVPMNPLAVATAAKVLATDDFQKMESLQDFEKFLRDAGFSKQAALQFVSAFKGIVLRRDAESDEEAKGGETLPDPPGPIITQPSALPILFGTDGRTYPLWTLKP